MEVRVYQINANRDFMGFAFTPLDHQTNYGKQQVQAQFYDLVYEGHISYEDFSYGYYTFEKRGPYQERHIYISDVIEVISSEHMEPGFYYVDPGSEYVKIEFDPAQAHAKEEIRVVFVSAGEEAEIVDIEATDASFEDLTGGMIGLHQYGDELTRMVLNRYGREMGMTTSRLIFKGPNCVEAIQGPFFICRTSRDSFESLPPDQLKKVLAELRYPQSFHRAGQSITAKAFNPKHKNKAYER